MKVAFITTNLSQDNGWGRYSYEIIKRMPQHGVEPVVLIMSSAKLIHLENVQIHPFLSSFADGILKPINLAIDFFTARKLVKHCAIIHCLAEPFIPLAYLLATNGKSLIINAVGTYSVALLKKRWGNFYRQAYLSATFILAISRYTAIRLTNTVPEIADKIRVITLGVSVNEQNYQPPSSQFRENAFLMVGHVKPRKGTLQAVKPMAKVVQKFPDAKLFIVGPISDEHYVQQVKLNVSKNEIEDNIIWLGKLSHEELNSYYNRVRGLVMPSINIGDNFEGFGLVHLEANAFGVPAIGSLDCGNEDAIRDGYSGFLVEQGNIQSLYEAMLKLLSSEVNWNFMSQFSRNFAKSKSWEKVLKPYSYIYKDTGSY
ncbi:glycosyltransferase family 4 protein [Coleofasciculus sp.]|uniref:glycosyltransferase family 4 protein n=1 Tax=Coleofasciculus sp. TaxID=3100458 RepID=UPI0039FAA4A5